MEFLKEVIFAIAGGSGFAALDWKTVVMLVIEIGRARVGKECRL